jgi:hypothetical protein
MSENAYHLRKKCAVNVHSGKKHPDSNATTISLLDGLASKKSSRNLHFLPRFAAARTLPDVVCLFHSGIKNAAVRRPSLG